MLKAAPRYWRERIQRCRAKLDRIQPAHRERIRAYAGPGYTGETNKSRYDPVGHAFTAISRQLPLMVSGAPRCMVGSAQQDGEKESQAIEAGLNRIAVQGGRRQLNEMLAVDYKLGPFAVCLTTSEPIPGYSEFADPKHWPTWHRVPPFDFFFDSDESMWTNWRFQGHRVVMDHDDAMEIAETGNGSGWDPDALALIAPGIVNRRPGDDIEDRQEFEYYEIWCPEITIEALHDLGYDPGTEDEYGRPYTPEGGYHGAVFYVLPDVDAKSPDEFIRDPRPFYGPRWGPYTFYPGYFVPDEGLPLAPQVATVAQAEAENTGARAMLRAIERNKRLVAISSTTPDLADAIEAEEDGGTIVLNDVEEISKHIAQIVTGGPYPELVASAAYLRDLNQVASGQGEGQSGQYGRRPDTSATEVAVASSATSNMLGFQNLKFREGNENDFRTAGWYMYHDELVEVQLGAEHNYGTIKGGKNSAILRRSPNSTAARRGELIYGSLEAAIEVEERKELKDSKLRKQDPFDQMVFAIDQLSMERTADGMVQAQLIGMRDTLAWLIPMLLSSPGVRIRETIKLVGDLSGVRGLERILDVPTMEAARASMFQMQMQAGQPEEAPPQKPMLSKGKPPMQIGRGSQAQPKPTAGGSSMAGRSTGSQLGARTKKLGAA